MSAHESLSKAYTAGTTQGGAANWVQAAGADTFRGQMGADGPVHLTDAQRKYILDRVINEATLLGMVRKYAMDRPAVAIPRMSVGTRIARANVAGGHEESTSMGTRVAPDFENVELKSSSIVLPWTITEEFLQDNPEKGQAEGLIADMMATQLANDLEDLAVNGDEAATSEPLLRGNNGFTKLGGSGNVQDFNGAAFTPAVFEAMLRRMPQKYRNRDKSKLKFFVPFNIEMDYVQARAARIGDRADGYLEGGAAKSQYGGIEIVPIAYLPSTGNVNGGNNESTIYLSDPQNMVFGVQKDVQMRKTSEGKSAIDFNERYYAMHVRCDFLIQNTEAFVLGKEITPRVEV